MEQVNYILDNTCLTCNGKKIHYDFSIDKYRVEECTDCGLMRLNPQPSNDELAKIYNENYFLTAFENKDHNSHVSFLKASTAKRYLDLIESYMDPSLAGGHLLEIGCGNGDFLLAAAERGFRVTGIEYSSHAAEAAAKKLSAKGEVICGEITHLLNTDKRFDFIIFADVLEHVRNPREFLKNTYSLLKENGIAITIVPSIDSFSARIMGNKWMEFKPEHLWYFSRKTLSRLLYNENFGEIKTHKAKKTLSFNYIAEHFIRYPTQPYTSVIQLFRQLIPNFLRKMPIRLNAGGIMMLAKKTKACSTKKLSVIMAVYNEEKTLHKTIHGLLTKKIPNVEIEIIIIESKSTDNTPSILKEFQNHERIHIIWQDKPLGKGNAIRAGLKKTTGDYILIQDADDEYDFEDYDALIEPLMTGEAAFVLGARHGGSAWKMRKFSDQRLAGHILNLGHWCFTLLVNTFFGLKLKDPFTMYKVFRADCLKNITFKCDRFDFDFELLIKLVKNGYKPIEVPVNYRSRSFKEGKKIRV
ncbi:MAG: glycosyltransferase, partial [Gammaproteobacteria bacterium]|nr:glycosyltransferase [Gammaproteobacteria bacterium]